MKLLEVHVLQTVAPSSLNRDDTGSPKDALFGGFRRARVSSQAQKRAVRIAFGGTVTASFSHEELACRTVKALRELLIPELVARGIRDNDAETSARAALGLLKKSKGGDREKKTIFSDKRPDETSYLLYLGKREVEGLVNFIAANLDTLKQVESPHDKKTKAVRKDDDKKTKALVPELVSLLDGGKAVDLALFGRMLADRPELGRDAAAQVAHAISTHKVDREFDFYTAVDDLNPKEETGAGMMGDVEFCSATLYRYAVVDLATLLKNLQEDKELAIRGALAFLEAFALTLPSGKQNSFAAHNPPLFVAFRAGVGLPRSLATAFERPMWPNDRLPLSAISAQALVQEWAKFDRVYKPLDPEWAAALDLTQTDLGEVVPRVTSLNDLKSEAEKALKALVEV